LELGAVAWPIRAGSSPVGDVGDHSFCGLAGAGGDRVALLLNPAQRRVRVVKGANLRMHEHPNSADEPVLPFMRGDDGDALGLLLVGLDEGGVLFEGGDAFPALQRGRVDQQPDGAEFLDDRIDQQP